MTSCHYAPPTHPHITDCDHFAHPTLCLLTRRPQVRAPFMLREFASGVRVVQSTSHSDEAICKRLGEMARPRLAGEAAGSAAAPADGGGRAAAAAVPAPVHVAGLEEDAPAAAAEEAAEPEHGADLAATLGPALTRLEVAVALGVSVAIAGEHLRTAEARGVLCRDEGPRGLVYYRNFFSDPSCISVAA